MGENEQKRKSPLGRIEQGTVFDRLNAGTGTKIENMLREAYPDARIPTIKNEPSTALGIKDLVKLIGYEVDERQLDIMGIVKLLAPTSHISIIRGSNIYRKIYVERLPLPSTITNYLRCLEQSCVTNHSSVKPTFSLWSGRYANTDHVHLYCDYCDKSFDAKDHQQLLNHMRV